MVYGMSGNSELHQSETSLLHYRIVGSVVLLHDIANKTCFSQNKIDIIRTCGFYRIIYHRLTIL